MSASWSIRRRAVLAGAAITLAAAAHAQAPQQQQQLRIGYQKGASLLVLQKAQGSLEKKVAPLGFGVKWVEFPAGPQLLEGLNVGSVDVGFVGEAPPIFAQAAGAPIRYVAYEPPAPKGEAILVPKGSPIKSVAELKGKKVALNKGSNVHYLLVKALEKANVKYSDITPVFLAPADARAAFERGAVDAWVIWDPFQAAAEAAIEATVLADGTDTVSNYQFYLSSQKFLESDPKVVDAILEGLREVDDWAKTDIKAVAEQLSPSVGLPVPVLEVALKRQAYGIKPIDRKVITEQQQLADTFLALGLIPKAIAVADAAGTPAP
jgi:sulfonate transport system substrate-binding protein